MSKLRLEQKERGNTYKLDRGLVVCIQELKIQESLLSLYEKYIFEKPLDGEATCTIVKGKNRKYPESEGKIIVPYCELTAFNRIDTNKKRRWF